VVIFDCDSLTLTVFLANLLTERSLGLASSQKCKELQQELTAEQRKYALLETQLTEKLARQEAEMQALHMRMHQSHEQHRAQVDTLRMQLEQLGGQNQVALIQRLQEENRQLKEQAQ